MGERRYLGGGGFDFAAVVGYVHRVDNASSWADCVDWGANLDTGVVLDVAFHQSHSLT